MQYPLRVVLSSVLLVSCATIVAAASAGCASGSSSTATEPTEPTEPTADTSESVASEPTSPALEASAVSVVPSSPTAGAMDSREITANECRVLAEKYADVTRSDQMANLSDKLTDAQRQTARTNIDEAALKLSSRWEKGCVTDLIGKVASEHALKCAMASKTVSTFDVCLSGGQPASQ